MSRKEFMQQLNRLLADIPESDRQDAIAYYNDYFDEAGPENEAEVIQELGSPGKVAATIKAGMGTAPGRGEFTENGYQDSRFKERTQVPAYKSRTGGQAEERNGKVGADYHPADLCFAAAAWIRRRDTRTCGRRLCSDPGDLCGVCRCGNRSGSRRDCSLCGGSRKMYRITREWTDLYRYRHGASGSRTVAFAVFVWLTFKVTPRVFRSVINWFSRIMHRGRGGESDEKAV